MAIDAEARIPVYINDEQARSALKTLTQEAERLRQKMVEALAAGDIKSYKKAESELKKVTAEARNLKNASFDVNNVINNLKTASVADLRKALASVRREQQGLNRESKEYADLQTKASRISGELKSVNSVMSEQHGILGGLLSSAKGLLPAFSFGAIAIGAKAAFDKIIKATDELSDQWDIVMGAMSSATNYFWTTLASGDWTNFFGNMREAIRLGAEYARTLDELTDRQRALSVEEADARQKILDLEVKLRNRTLSDEERIKAGEERIKIEEDLAAIRVKNAQKAFDNELQNNIKFAKLGKDRTMQIITDLDSQDRKDAEVFNQKQQRAAKLEGLQSQGTVSPEGVVIQTGPNYSGEIRKLNEELSKTPENIQQYAKAIQQYGKSTDEERDRLVKTYTDLKDAQNSAVENTKKVRTQVNTLLAGEDQKNENRRRKEQTTNKEQNNIILKQLDDAYQQRMFMIEKQHIDENTSDADFNLKKLIAERAYLEQKKALLIASGESSAEISRKIIQIELDAIRGLKEMTEKQSAELLKNVSDDQKDIADAMTSEISKAVDTNIEDGKRAIKEMQDNQDYELMLIDERKNAYLELADSVGASLGELLSDSEASFGDFLRNTLVMVLQTLEKLMLANVAEAAMKGIAQGGIGIFAAAAKIVAIKAAFALAKGAILSGGKNKEKNGYAEGGYTGPGASTETAGIVHKGEYVVSRRMLEEKSVSNIVKNIETLRKDQSATINDIVLNEGPEFSAGGYTGVGAVNDPAGIVHKGEYVVPAYLVKDKTVKPVINYLEIIRKTNSTGSLNIRSIYPETRGYAAGGIVSPAEKGQVTQMVTVQNNMDSELKEMIRQNIIAINTLMAWKPKVYTELIKKDLDTLESINKNSKM